MRYERYEQVSISTTVTPKIKVKSEEATKVTLEVDSKDWINVLKYISNSEIKALGLPVIVEQLQKKFKITATTKKELSKHI